MPTPVLWNSYLPDLQNSNGSRYIWKICRGKPNVGDLGVTDDVTGQVKVKVFDDLAYLALSRSTAVQMEISQYSDMDRFWDTAKYHPKPSVSIFKIKVIQRHEVKNRYVLMTSLQNYT